MLNLEITMNVGNNVTMARWELVKGKTTLRGGSIELFAVRDITELFKFECNCKAIRQLIYEVEHYYKDKIETNFYIKDGSVVISYFNRKTFDKLRGTIWGISNGYEKTAWD